MSGSATAEPPARAGLGRFRPGARFGRDLSASFVVFLVALPLCMGIAVASGVPAEKGLVTGIVGGVVVGLLAGSPLQVSGPAAGLAVIVFEIVRDHGLRALGPILLAAGTLQLLAGWARLGTWFRVISPAVVHGMLAGIGVLIVAGQLHVMMDGRPLPGGLSNLLALPAAVAGLLPLDGSADEPALAVGLLTVAVMLGWERWRPARLRLVPGALVGVLCATVAAAAFTLPVRRVQVPANLLDAITPPAWAELGMLADPALLVTALAVAFIASAETLLSASAVDRMHTGPRTLHDRELRAQGVGNLLCGLLGGLPMTGVIVRSSANVQAGAQTRLSTVLHGTWLLLTVAAVPFLLSHIPLAALAGVLVVTGWRLVNLRHARDLLAHYGPYPALIWAATLLVVVGVDLLTGVMVGLGLTALELLPLLPRISLAIRRRDTPDGDVSIVLRGWSTFIHLPRLLQTLDTLPPGRSVRLRTRGLMYLDHTCRDALADWIGRYGATGGVVRHDDAPAPTRLFRRPRQPARLLGVQSG